MKQDRNEQAAERAALMSEHQTLLTVQRAIQRLLNAKGFRYRDLARRMGVSEARVSHLFGDEPTNLTLKTIARIFHVMDESLMVMTKREFDAKIADAEGRVLEHEPMWHLHFPDFVVSDHSSTSGEHLEFAMERAAFPKTMQWIIADEASMKRKQVA